MVFDYIKLAILIMQLVNKVLDYAHDQGLIQQGRDEEIAATASAILFKTQVGKKIRERIDAMPDDEVDKALVGLEPSGTGGPKPV